jgi:hypothetical protein
MSADIPVTETVIRSIITSRNKEEAVKEIVAYLNQKVEGAKKRAVETIKNLKPLPDRKYKNNELNIFMKGAKSMLDLVIGQIE